MKVHPAIAALRSDMVSQRRSQTAMKVALADWQAGEAESAVDGDLRRFAAGSELAELSALHALVTDHTRASVWTRKLCAAFIDALRQEPLGEVPFRHSTSGTFSRLQLMQSGGAVLSLCTYESSTVQIAPKSVQFSDCDAHEIIIAGRVRGKFYSRPDQASGQEGALNSIHSRACLWTAGDRIMRRARLDTRHFAQVEQSVLMLQLTRMPARPEPSLELQIEDGSLVRQVSGNKRASQQVMALAVLGALGDQRALHPMEHFARDPDQDADARWEAVRQILALDAARGLALLTQIAARSADPLARPAADLQRNLLASQPALRALISESV